MTWIPWAQMLTILGIAAFMGGISRWVLAKLKGIKKTPAWASTLYEALHLPAPWLIWGAGLFLSLKVLTTATEALLSQEILVTLCEIFFALFTLWILLGWKKRYEKVLKKRLKDKTAKAQDEALVMAVSRVLSVVIIITAIFTVLQIFNIPLAALLAFGGVGGVAIGFAGKDVVANFFGGLMIHINRPFAPGDRIRSVNKNLEGVVEEIGWYATRLRSLDRKPVYVPNALFIDTAIENYTRMYNQRIKQSIGVRYQDVNKIESIVAAIRDLLENHQEIDQDNIRLVHFVAFGPYALEIEVICFTKTISRPKMRDIQQEIFLSIANIVETHGAEIAFPTNTIHLDKRLS